MRRLFLVFAGLFLLSACGDETESKKLMRAFFLSINELGETDCGYENADMYLDGDESSESLDVEIVSLNPASDTNFSYKGTRVVKNGKEYIATYYVIEREELYPSTMNVVSRDDPNLGRIFTGYWSGEAIRPEGELIVACPYVLVPRELLPEDSCESAVLKKYLGDATCYRLLADEGNLSPAAFE